MRPEIANTPIPHLMKKLRRDKRGYPIPVIVVRDIDGKPQFTTNDEDMRQHVIRNDKCGICGNKLYRFRAIAGGPVSAFDENGAFIDPPMHIECAQYAMQVCPYLAALSWTKEIGPKLAEKIDKPIVSGMTGETLPAIFIDQTMQPGRPEGQMFCLVVHTDAEYSFWDTQRRVIQYIKPKRPYIRVEYWRFGKQIPNEEGLAIAKQALLKQYTKDYEDAISRADELVVKALARSQPKGPLRYPVRSA